MTTSAENPYTKSCGCLHRGQGHKWERCAKHVHEQEVEALLEKTFGKPVCPEGCGDVRRPKCLWEASNCPRHEVKDRWNKLLKAAIRYLDQEEEE